MSLPAGEIIRAIYPHQLSLACESMLQDADSPLPWRAKFMPKWKGFQGKSTPEPCELTDHSRQNL